MLYEVITGLGSFRQTGNLQNLQIPRGKRFLPDAVRKISITRAKKLRLDHLHTAVFKLVINPGITPAFTDSQSACAFLTDYFV